MEIVWLTAGTLMLITFGLAFVRSRECKRLELLGRSLETQ